MQRNCLKTQTEKNHLHIFRNTEKKSVPIAINIIQLQTFFCGMRKTSFICIKIALTKLKHKDSNLNIYISQKPSQ